MHKKAFLYRIWNCLVLFFRIKPSPPPPLLLALRWLMKTVGESWWRFLLLLLFFISSRNKSESRFDTQHNNNDKRKIPLHLHCRELVQAWEKRYGRDARCPLLHFAIPLRQTRRKKTGIRRAGKNYNLMSIAIFNTYVQRHELEWRVHKI